MQKIAEKEGEAMIGEKYGTNEKESEDVSLDGLDFDKLDYDKVEKYVAVLKETLWESEQGDTWKDSMGQKLEEYKKTLPKIYYRAVQAQI